MDLLSLNQNLRRFHNTRPGGLIYNDKGKGDDQLLSTLQKNHEKLQNVKL